MRTTTKLLIAIIIALLIALVIIPTLAWWYVKEYAPAQAAESAHLYLPVVAHNYRDVCQPPNIRIGDGCLGPPLPPKPTPTPASTPAPPVDFDEEPTAPPPTPFPQYDPLPDDFDIPETRERFGWVQDPIDKVASAWPEFDPETQYHSVQFAVPDDRSEAVFLDTASRADNNKWCVGTFKIAGRPDYCADPDGSVGDDTPKATTTGWVDEAALRAWIENHPGKTYHVGNEPYCGLPSCNNDLIYQSYARWYYYSWQLVKSIDPTAAVCSAIPIGWNKPGEESSLYKLWNTYRLITGNVMPSDCWPIHRYAVHGEGGWTLEGEIAFYDDRLDWLEAHRGTNWIGRFYPILSEFGFLSWRYNVPDEEQMELMVAIVPWLIEQDRIVEWAWWPSYNETCEGFCGQLLDRFGNLTPLGALYAGLAMGE